MRIAVEEGQISLFDLPMEKEEKMKYGLKDTLPNKHEEGNIEIKKIMKHYKDTCKFIVKGKYGIMIHLNNKALFYGYDGKRTSINSSFVPPKPLGKVLVDNIGAYKNKEVKKGQAIKKVQHKELNIGDLVSFMYKGQLCMGTIRRIYNEGETVNVDYLNKVIPFYYKSVTLIKKQSEMQSIQFIKDCTELNKEFIKDSIFNVYEEKEGNYIIYKDGTFYGISKENCRKGEVDEF